MMKYRIFSAKYYFFLILFFLIFAFSFPQTGLSQTATLSGGTSFQTAIPFPQNQLGLEFKIDKHLDKNEGYFFYLDIKAGTSLTLSSRTTNIGVRYNSGELVDEEGKSCYSSINLYNSAQEKLSTLGARALGCQKSGEVAFTPTDGNLFKKYDGSIDQRVYFVIGSEKNYRMTKYGIYQIDLEYVSQASPEPEPEPIPAPVTEPTPTPEPPKNFEPEPEPKKSVSEPPKQEEPAPKTSSEVAEISKVQVILDASGSMNAKVDGVRKYDIAVQKISETIRNLPAGVEASLRVYGNNFSNKDEDRAESCTDSNLLVDFTSENISGKFNSALNPITPTGWTPIALSLEKAGENLRTFSGGRHSVVLISDGGETCNGNPNDVARSLRESGINVVIHTVGFDVDFRTESQLESLAKAGEGKYYQANDSEELEEGLSEIFGNEVQKQLADDTFEKEFKPKEPVEEKIPEDPFYKKYWKIILGIAIAALLVILITIFLSRRKNKTPVATQPDLKNKVKPKINSEIQKEPYVEPPKPPSSL